MLNHVMSECSLPSSAGNINNTVQWICLQHQQLKEYPLIQAEVYFKSLMLDRLHSLSRMLNVLSYSLCYMLYVLFFPGLGLSLPLGTDYENKKNKLRQELQLDYKYFVATV